MGIFSRVSSKGTIIEKIIVETDMIFQHGVLKAYSCSHCRCSVQVNIDQVLPKEIGKCAFK